MRFPRLKAFVLAIICLCSATFGSRVCADDKNLKTLQRPHSPL